MTIGEAFDSIIDAARQGDRAAIAALYEDTVPLVRGYLFGQRAYDVDDLTNDVYVSMMGSLDRFSGTEDRFRSWLLTIAHRRLVDSYRRNQRRPEEPTDLGSGALDVVARSDPSEEALERLRTSGLLDAIDGLTPDQRSVLLLRALADLPIREISEVTGKPETAVKALLRRAVASLQRAIDADPGEG